MVVFGVVVDVVVGGYKGGVRGGFERVRHGELGLVVLLDLDSVELGSAGFGGCCVHICVIHVLYSVYFQAVGSI